MRRVYLLRLKRRGAACAVLALAAVVAWPAMRLVAQDQDDEIVATLAGGRVIVHATAENIAFAAINEPLENGTVPPRVVSLDSHHVGVLLGSSEWRIPAEPAPIRMDKGLSHIAVADPKYQGAYNDTESDLETIGVAFLEKLTPLAARLHHKLDFPHDQPLFELVVIGFGPHDYGSEVWTLEYGMTQSVIATRGDYWQTKVMRPRFEQLYPPEKHAPRKLVETCYPSSACKGPQLQQLLEGNEPSLAKLSDSDPRYLKAVDFVTKGQAQKAASKDFAEFLRAAIPIVYPGRQFVLGTFEEQRGFNWIVPPEEPIERAQKQPEDKNRPAEAPTLRRRVDPPR